MCEMQKKSTVCMSICVADWEQKMLDCTGVCFKQRNAFNFCRFLFLENACEARKGILYFLLYFFGSCLFLIFSIHVLLLYLKVALFISYFYLCVLWGLWRDRNFRLFEDVEVKVGALCRNVLNMLYLWVSAHSLGSMPYADFLLSCSFRSSN